MVRFIALVAVLCMSHTLVRGQDFFSDWKTVAQNHEQRIAALEKQAGLVAALPAPKVVPVKSAVTVAKSHWTHPDTISNHLQSDQYAAEVAAMGVTLVGMSQEQMLTLHDQLHENRRTVIKSISKPVVSSGGCPGGVCPSQRTVTRNRAVGPFGRLLGF